MKTSIFKMTYRSIKSFYGRYIAILLIVALSVGFFAGLKLTEDAMATTCEGFLTDQGFYDFRLFSTLGFTKKDVEAFEDLSGIKIVEAVKTVDMMMFYEDSENPMKIFSMPSETNLPKVIIGRLPEANDECLVDRNKFDKDDIGKIIKVGKENDEEYANQLEEKEYTIVGISDSPLYMGMERGTTSIGSGSLAGYIYINEDNFSNDIYTEINIILEEKEKIYSDEYDKLIDLYKGKIEDLCSERSDLRYNAILAELGITSEVAEAMGIEEAENYILTRNDNSGYVSFENDTSIISGIANIFPIFFIMIAMLVCMTTMTRMVDEERMQIGVLKAMGFSNKKIMAKYLLYAGSATFIGWAVGFFLCTWGLPEIFWFAYNAIYDFAPLTYVFSPILAGATFVVSMVGILGSTFLSCKKELLCVPAKLVRPRTAKKGKRILLERVTFLWKRFTFLQKITLRNMFRYKKRFIMMIIGISCCAALVVTAFGVRDSMINIGDLQFEEVQKYQLTASFEEGKEEAVKEELAGISDVDNYVIGLMQRVDIVSDKVMNSVSLLSFKDKEKLAEFWDFHTGDKKLSYPDTGEVFINIKVADKLSLSVGDTIEVRDADMKTCTVKVGGIFDNYLFNFIVMDDKTYSEAFGQWGANTALIQTDGDEEKVAEIVNEQESVTSVSQLSKTQETVTGALSCLDYIIWLIVLFSGALAFIVIFNLTNINIAERSREIATVLVLGFNQKETESYVLRENLVLSVIASVIGLPLGMLFHKVVMSMVLIDALSFDVHIEPVSYVLAFVCTVFFAVIVNIFMKKQIGKIHMAESLKAVE